MDFENIITLISNLGFPIACCVVLFIQNNKLTNTLNEISRTMGIMSERLDDIEAKMNKRRSDNGKKENYCW